jgi:hypothetical protein
MAACRARGRRRAVRGRVRGEQGVRPGRVFDEGRQPGRGGRQLPEGRAGGTGQHQLPDRAAARAADGVAVAPREGARVRAEGSARGGARRIPAGERLRSKQPDRDREGHRNRSPDPRPHRSRAPEAGDHADARARAGRLGGTDPQSVVARAAELPLQQRQRPRHPDDDRQRGRLQRQLRSRVRRSAGDRAARSGHARAGAQPDHDDEPALVQGAERAVHLRVPGHAAQARPVRRAGGSRRTAPPTP